MRADIVAGAVFPAYGRPASLPTSSSRLTWQGLRRQIARERNKILRGKQWQQHQSQFRTKIEKKSRPRAGWYFSAVTWRCNRVVYHSRFSIGILWSMKCTDYQYAHLS